LCRLYYICADQGLRWSCMLLHIYASTPGRPSCISAVTTTLQLCHGSGHRVPLHSERLKGSDTRRKPCRSRADARADGATHSPARGSAVRSVARSPGRIARHQVAVSGGLQARLRHAQHGAGAGGEEGRGVLAGHQPPHLVHGTAHGLVGPARASLLPGRQRWQCADRLEA